MIPSGAAHNDMILGPEHDSKLSDGSGLTDAGMALV